MVVDPQYNLAMKSSYSQNEQRSQIGQEVQRITAEKRTENNCMLN
jgi:hypothetical protein